MPLYQSMLQQWDHTLEPEAFHQPNKAITEQMTVRRREPIPAFMRNPPWLMSSLDMLLEGPNPPTTPLVGEKVPGVVPGVVVAGVDPVPAALEEEEEEEEEAEK